MLTNEQTPLDAQTLPMTSPKSQVRKSTQQQQTEEPSTATFRHTTVHASRVRLAYTILEDSPRFQSRPSRNFAADRC